MPTYEYACSACGHQWEQSQRITEAPIEVCPKCAQSTAHRLISGGTNFILKGGGWYSDLYSSPKRDSSPKGGESSGESKPAAGESSGGGTTESAKSGSSDSPGAKASSDGAKSSASSSSTPAASS